MIVLRRCFHRRVDLAAEGFDEGRQVPVALDASEVRISVIPYTQFGVFEREVSEAA
jgi:hypothetical protein